MTGNRLAITSRTRRALRWATLCGLALVLFAGQVLALGLGRIEVKSRAGEPLLAEIQVISNDPAELDQLRARLASPDTFRRIGLAAPDDVVSGLEFTVALDARGNPVIRVTSREPVNRPIVAFLVEVDWGQGRLVREYAALVDAPQTVAAPAQPAIQAPVAAPSNTIVREPRPEPEAEPVAGATTDGTAAEDSPAPDPVAASTEDEAAAPAPAPVAAPPPPPVAATADVAQASEYGPVQAGETLGEIASRFVGDGVSREQAIVALFRANPQAFIANNLNLVRQGAVLRIPDRGEIAALDARESRALMREQIAAWREMTRPAPQPDAAVAGASEGSPGQAGEGAEAGGSASQTADARLEIVPPAASGGQQAGVRSGIQAGGEGEMLRQELQQELLESRETVAAREAEVAELKARVADLERLQAQQAELITMKDSELAAVQERLATGTETTATQATEAPVAESGGGLPWLWIGLGLLVVLAVAWLLARRAPKATPRPRFDSESLAAAAPRRESDAVPAASPAPAPPLQPAAAAPAVPAWHTGAPAASLTGSLAADDAGSGRGPEFDPTAITSLNPAPGGPERIELARAYIDLGDVETARELLREVAQAGDPAARAEASRLLDGIA